MSYAEQRYKPTVFKRGLAIVLVPLVITTVTYLSLNQLWLSAKTLLTQEKSQAETVRLMNYAIKAWQSASHSYLALGTSPNYAKEVKELNATTRMSLDSLKRAVEKDPKGLFKVELLRSMFEGECASYATVAGHLSEHVLSIRNTLESLLFQGYELHTRTVRLLQNTSEEFRATWAEQESACKELTQFIYAMTAFNLIIGAVLAWLFATPIALRMHLLIENTRHLYRGEPFERRLRGNDEFAYLDKVIYESSQRLLEAAEHRRHILSMVAHDARSPIMSARANLQIMEEVVDGFPDEAIDELQSVYRCLSDVLEFVNYLLTARYPPTQDIGAVDVGVSKTAEPTEAPLAINGDGREVESTNPTPFGNAIAHPVISFLVHPKLFQQSWIVSTAPLLIQAAMLLFVNEQIRITEGVAREQLRCTDTIIYSDMIIMDMLSGTSAGGLYSLTKNPDFHQKENEYFEKALQDEQRLNVLYPADPEAQTYIVQIKAKVENTISQLRTLDPGRDFIRGLKLVFEARGAGRELPEVTNQRTKIERWFDTSLDRIEELQQSQERVSTAISAAIVYALVANCLLALFMLVLFAARTNKRFKLLMSSAACLGQRQPIASRLPGRDELSALDAAVHYADDRLRAASKERSLIMSCLADEMRVPLVDAVVHMQRFEILAQKELSEKARGYLTVSKSSVDKIIRLLDDLVTIEELDIGKVDLKVETCNASDIAADAISAVIGLAAEKEISIVNLCPAIDVEADKLRIVQVLINYLANAVKFSQKHTNIQVNCKKLQNHVRFYVTDEGPGLDGETCKHVFERYYQGGGEPRGQGYGLGLAICRLIVLSHGGRIGVESEVGTGSTFWFELPIA